MLRLTHLTLRVSDLAVSRDFYVQRLGFVAAPPESNQVALSVAPGAPAILSLLGDPAGTRATVGTAGLFHAALLFPSRAALGSWFAFAASRQVEFDGFSDHGVSEAVYLSDPDGNGLEFYADRPRTEWPFRDGELAMTSQRLAVQELLALARPPAIPLQGACWGHLHLRVTDLERSEAFYRSTLGVDVTQRSYPGARFLAADGYHHHLGLNTWGNPTRPQPADVCGLVEATFTRSGFAGASTLFDPDSIPLRLAPPAL